MVSHLSIHVLHTKSVPDLVVSAETDPVGDGTVLLHLLAEDALGLERLVGRLEGELRAVVGG